jgi:hypothetical protein
VTTFILAGCGGNPGDRQTVRGTFVRVGGPASGSPVPLTGTITARAATGRMFTATAGRNGRFTLSLLPGCYHVTGRSPLMQSGQMICAATAELHVTRSRSRAPSPWSARFPRDGADAERAPMRRRSRSDMRPWAAADAPITRTCALRQPALVPPRCRAEHFGGYTR